MCVTEYQTNGCEKHELHLDHRKADLGGQDEFKYRRLATL